MATTDSKKQWRGHPFVGLKAELLLNWPPPLWQLTISYHAIELTQPRGAYRQIGGFAQFILPKAMVELVEQRRLFWSRYGIRIHHVISEYPKMLHFTPFWPSCQGILRHLKSLGYNVRR